MDNKYKLTNTYEIIDKMRAFTEAHIRYEKSVNCTELMCSENAHVVSSVADYSNGDCSRYDITTVTLGDIEVSVQMLTLKYSDLVSQNVEVYLAPYGGGELDVAAD